MVGPWRQIKLPANWFSKDNEASGRWESHDKHNICLLLPYHCEVHSMQYFQICRQDLSLVAYSVNLLINNVHWLFLLSVFPLHSHLLCYFINNYTSQIPVSACPSGAQTMAQ